MGATAVGLAWVFLGGNGSTSTSSFQVSPGIPPVVFVYLDNGHIASYLAQLQGGAATTETLSQQATQERNASVSANGVGAGASSSQQSAAQLSLTVNNQSRFADLLGLLQARGYLHTINMAARDNVVKRGFAAVPVGDFVKLSHCSLSLPNYVLAEQAWRAADGHMSIASLALGSGPERMQTFAEQSALASRAKAEHKKLPYFPVPDDGFPRPGVLARAKQQINHLVGQVGTDPRVPLSSCRLNYNNGYDPRAADLLMPVGLREFTSNPAALAGGVTLVGKVMLALRGPSEAYVDLASLQQWSGAAFWTGREELGLREGGLDNDATVLSPGYVIQPIAIYK